MDYHQNLRKNLAAFIASRLIPYLGITFVLVLQAHESFSDLSLLAYVLATYAVPVSLLSMLLAVVGNLVALNGDDFAKHQRLFRSGLAVGSVLAVCVLLICLSIHFLWINRINLHTVDPIKLGHISQIYIFSTPFLLINMFLFFFNEAYSRASSSALIKLSATAGALLLSLIAFWLSRRTPFVYFAATFFVLLEITTLVLYGRLSKNRGFRLRPLFSPAIFKDILAMGIPVAFGLGIQKFYFLLFTDRLIRMDSEMVSILSVSMSIIGLLVIPVAAFSQLHSLYIGSDTRSLLAYNRTGSTYLSGLMAGLAGLFLLFSDNFYQFFASDHRLIPAELPLAVAGLFLATALINFSMGQLRALKDTLVPQAIIGAVLLLGLYPLIVSTFFDGASLSAFLYAEASALVVCYCLLQHRTYRLGRRQKPQYV